MTRLFRLYLSLLAWVIAASVVAAERQPNGSSLAAEARLSRRISISTRRILIGELLEQLSKDTGVRLSASDRVAPISGYPLTVVVHDRPAAEVLEAVRRLYHFPPDRWYWTREGSGYHTGFTLRSSLTPAAIAAARQRFAENFVLESRRRAARFFQASPPERAAMAANDPALASFGESPQQFERSRHFFSLIAPLSDAALQSVMRGQPVEVPVARLSLAQRQWLQGEYRMRNFLGKEDIVQPDQLEKLQVVKDPEDVSVGVDLGPLGTYSVLGGYWLDGALRTAATTGWKVAGEENHAEGRVPAEGVTPRNNELALAGVEDDIVQRLGRLGRVNVILDRSRVGQFSAAGSTLQGPVAEALGALEKGNLIWKRWSSYYLLRRSDWQARPWDSFVPWSEIKRYRKVAAEHDGYFTEAEWIELASLRREQLEQLSEEFPDATPIARYQVALRLIEQMNGAERAAARRPEGSGWNEWAPGTRQRMNVLYPSADLRQVRLTYRFDPERQPARVRVFLGPGAYRPVEVSLKRMKIWNDAVGAFVDRPAPAAAGSGR